MKKNALFIIIGFVGTSLFGQSVNVAQRIIGSWKGTMDGESLEMTFTAAGLVTILYVDDNDVEIGNYIITDTALIIKIDGYVEVFTYHFSHNGNILVVDLDGDWTWLERQ